MKMEQYAISTRGGREKFRSGFPGKSQKAKLVPVLAVCGITWRDNGGNLGGIGTNYLQLQNAKSFFFFFILLFPL